MVERQKLSDSQILNLVTRLRDLRWSWDAAEVGSVVDRFGWTVEFEYQGNVRLDTGLGMATGDISTDDSGRVTMIGVALCSYVDKQAAAERRWLQDVFVSAVELVTESLGAPSHRLPGEYPEVRWRLSSESTLGITRSSTIARMYLALNDYLDEADRYQGDDS